MKRSACVLLLVAGLVSACSPPAPAAPDTAADTAAVNQLRSDYQAAFNAGDMAKLEALYAEDAVEYPANEPSRQGRAAIMAATQAMAAMGKHEITLTATDTQVSGDRAFDIGTYHMVMTPAAGGEAMMLDGRYMVILRREADGWKLARLMDNMSAPMAMPPGGMPMGAPAATPTR